MNSRDCLSKFYVFDFERFLKTICNIPGFFQNALQFKMGYMHIIIRSRFIIVLQLHFYSTFPLGVRQKKDRVSFKKKVAPQTGSILVRIITILPPNLGEDQKKGLRRKSGLTLAGILDLLTISKFCNLILSNLKYCAWVLQCTAQLKYCAEILGCLRGRGAAQFRENIVFIALLN